MNHDSLVYFTLKIEEKLKFFICFYILGLKFKWCFFFGTVLSDSNKRLMYDVGVYDSDDDENVRHLFHTIHISWVGTLFLFHLPSSIFVLCFVSSFPWRGEKRNNLNFTFFHTNNFGLWLCLFQFCYLFLL